MSWVERAKVGDRVVCLGCDWTMNIRHGFSVPAKNSIYTIRDIVMIDGSVCLRFCEIINRCGRHYKTREVGEPCFNWHHFRPVRDTTLQVEAIKRAALDVPAKSPETVA